MEINRGDFVPVSFEMEKKIIGNLRELEFWEIGFEDSLMDTRGYRGRERKLLLDSYNVVSICWEILAREILSKV